MVVFVLASPPFFFFFFFFFFSFFFFVFFFFFFFFFFFVVESSFSPLFLDTTLLGICLVRKNVTTLLEVFFFPSVSKDPHREKCKHYFFFPSPTWKFTTTLLPIYDITLFFSFFPCPFFDDHVLGIPPPPPPLPPPHKHPLPPPLSPVALLFPSSSLSHMTSPCCDLEPPSA